MTTKAPIAAHFFPEVSISGYTSIDGTVEFYSRIKSLLRSDMVVLDYGAGRSGWYFDDTCQYRRDMRLMKGHVRKVIGCDIDSAILENESVDEKFQIEPDGVLPLDDHSVDLIISDYTFEHLNAPERVVSEFSRILKPGGWVCARTPNKISYMPLIARLVKNDAHARMLKYVQPGRKEIDVFPTVYKLNSMKELNQYFDSEQYINHSYRYEPEPAYHFGSKMIYAATLLLHRLLPPLFKSHLFVFIQKRS